MITPRKANTIAFTTKLMLTMQSSFLADEARRHREGGEFQVRPGLINSRIYLEFPSFSVPPCLCGSSSFMRVPRIHAAIHTRIVPNGFRNVFDFVIAAEVCARVSGVTECSEYERAKQSKQSSH